MFTLTMSEKDVFKRKVVKDRGNYSFIEERLNHHVPKVLHKVISSDAIVKEQAKQILRNDFLDALTTKKP